MCQISRRSEYAFACYSNFCKCAKRRRKKKQRKKKRNFGHSYLGNGLSDFLQIWNVDSPSWRATLQQIWFQSDEVSPRYKCVKMTFSFFLSIYSRCGAPASWAARHTIVCLDSVAFGSLISVQFLPSYSCHGFVKLFLTPLVFNPCLFVLSRHNYKSFKNLKFAKARNV